MRPSIAWIRFVGSLAAESRYALGLRLYRRLKLEPREEEFEAGSEPQHAGALDATSGATGDQWCSS